MADRIITLGGKVGGIEGQLCLAPLPYDYGALAGADLSQASSWIFEETLNAADVGIGTHYPVGMILDDLMELYWRMRTVETLLQFEYTEDSDPEPKEVYTVDEVHDVPYQEPVASEADLVNGVGRESDTHNGIRMVLFEEGADPKVKFYDGQYYPRLRLYGGTLGVYYIDTLIDQNDDTGAIPVFMGHPNNPSNTHPVPCYVSEGAFTTLVPQSLKLWVNCAHFWTHAKPTGGDKWNVNNGELIP